MKRVIFLASTIFLLMFSCSQSDKTKLVLTLSEKNIEFTSVGGEREIIVTANTEWEVSYEADWIEVEVTGNKGNGSILIRALPIETNDEREAGIIVTAPSGIDEEIIITQIDYRNTIVNKYSSWAILGQVACPECPVFTEYIYFDGDSTIEGIKYKKVFLCDDKSHENIRYEGLLREHELKTYWIPKNLEKEYLLYDFSLEEGMIFEYIEPHVIPEYEYPVSLYVKNVNFVEINGVQKKQIRLEVFAPDLGVNNMSVTWIEKVGSLNGLFYPCGILAPGVKRELLCYFQNNKLFYKNPNYSECYYDNH